ncbi:ABC transporter substrate-binding protein [Sulfurirhabdus autotrophica]|nr:ABC transporter substrate-binding protein [Sulfurirhabdus autotrophica]
MLIKFTNFVISALLISLSHAALAEERIVVSVPGPKNISYLPIDLIQKLGFDRDEGVKLLLLHTGGGAVALNHLITRNADFAVAGLPAAMSLRANGGDVVAVAAVDDAPLFVLMVRISLKTKIKRISDLKGLVIGVNTSTKNSKTTSQQLAELLLKSGGVSLDQVRIVPAGQNWEEQSSLILSGAADAIMGDEPFASRLLAEKKVFFLANLSQPESVKNIPGTHFLHAALETRSDVIANTPQKVEKMARMLQRTLKWIASHTPEDLVAKLEMSNADERSALLVSLKKYRHAYSIDGKFSTRQLKETEIFFQSSSEGDSNAQALRLETMVDDRWIGRSH